MVRVRERWRLFAKVAVVCARDAVRFRFPENGKPLSTKKETINCRQTPSFRKMVRRDITRHSCRPQAVAIAPVAGIRTLVRGAQHEPFPSAPLDHAFE